MYVRLFHGRKHPNEKLDDWGKDGPIIGPVGVSWTYGTLKLHGIDSDGNWTDMEEVATSGPMADLIHCGGMHYGDMEVWASTDPLAIEAVASGRTISFEEWVEQNGQ